jgi:hypothetical protein
MHRGATSPHGRSRRPPLAWRPRSMVHLPGVMAPSCPSALCDTRCETVIGMPTMCSMQTHRWPDGRQLCGTGEIARLGRFPDPLQGNNRWEGWRGPRLRRGNDQMMQPRLHGTNRGGREPGILRVPDNTAATPKHFPSGLFPQLQRSSGKCNVAFGNSGATSKCVDQRWDRLKCKHCWGC